MKQEPIVVIDNDIEDLVLLREIIAGLNINNEIVTFSDPKEAFDFLCNTILIPAVIICDINMPKMNGFQFREELLLEDSNIKDAPFVFLSTSMSEMDIARGQELQVHSNHLKASNLSGLEQTIGDIMVSLNILPV